MERFVTATYRTTCYHCQTEAEQVITAVPNLARVVCDHCGATRVFVPVIEDIAPKQEYIKPGCYDVWNLGEPASCRNCGVHGSHDITIGCRNFTVRCRNCGFTHLYRFNLEYMAGEEPS